MNNNYTNIRDFGKQVQGNDPLTYCLVDTMDKNFYSVIGDLYGPRSNRCQAYMADYCSKDWNGYCEYYYQQHQPENSDTWPNTQHWPNTEQNNVFGAVFNQPQSMGNQLLQNASARKYCDYVNCGKRCESFDPMNPNSPKITFYENNRVGQGCVPVCRVNTNEIDNDPLMDRMLSNPTVVAPTLINICNSNPSLKNSNTKIGQFCKRYERNLK